MNFLFRSAFFALFLVISFGNAFAQNHPVISEFMASNARAVQDQDGDYPDWIEIFNPSQETVSLSGWYLTDSEVSLTKWRFPDVSLPPKAFLVVFASGKDRAIAGQQLHTSFSLNAGGEYLALVRPDGVTVASEFAPAFPSQAEDISYGIAQDVQTNSFLQVGAAVRWRVPGQSGDQSGWETASFTDSHWAAGKTGLGYQTSIPGFAVRNIKANLNVSNLDVAESVIKEASRQSRIDSENSAVLNYFGTGSEAHYPDNRVFPGHILGADIDDFVIEATATITIPAAGDWTFGVNSDDGFGLTIGGFSLSYPNPRAPGDTLGVFSAPAPGDYPLRLVFYERGGGAGLELFAAKGRFTGWNPTNFRLVGDLAGGGLGVRSSAVSGGSSSGGYRDLLQTDLTSALAGRNSSVYLRIPFTIGDLSAVESLVLRVKYDDGFVAYINGVEVARRNAPANLAWNSAATAAHPNAEAVQFEQFSIGQLDALREGANVLAIHGLNVAADDVDFLIVPELVEYKVQGLTAQYFSTPTPGQPNGSGFVAFVKDTKFDPDRGFYTAPFSLTIRTETAGATIRYTKDGTMPSLTNGLTYSAPITISGTTTIRAAAFKEGHQPSNVDTQTYLFINDIVRQSPTGQAPPGWPASWGANEVNYGMDPDIVDHTAYKNLMDDALLSIPSFSIVMDLKHLFDPAVGIYANPGQDGRAWERPCSVELIHPDGTDGFQVNAGIRIRGGFSRSTGNPKHAFRLFFRREYGDSKLRYPLFGDAGAQEFDGIDLRTFQNYSWSFQGDGRGVFVRDQFSRDTQLAMGHHAERGEFYHLYINGQYWGLFNTCERPEASYGETYLGGSKEDYDVIKVEAGPYIIQATDGDMNAWSKLYDLANAGFSSNAAYFRVQGRNPDGTLNPNYENLLDVPNLIDYMLVILYGGNLDAPISNFLGNSSPNNFFALRNRHGPLGFRFFAHDAEHTLLNVFEDRTGPYSAGDSSILKSNPQWIWQKLQANPEFRLLVADHVQKHFFNGGALTVASSKARLDKRKQELDLAVIGESARWGDAKRATPFTRADWLNAFNGILNDFVPRRSDIVVNQLRSDGLYPSVTAPSFSRHGGNVIPGFKLSMTAPSGTIYYTTDGSDPRLIGGSISPRAQIYRAQVSLNESATVKARVWQSGTWSALTEASFTLIQTFTELFITEMMYNPLPGESGDSDDFEFIELKNVGGTELDLSGVHFTDGVVYKFANGTRLGPGEFLVLASDPVQFATRYPGRAVHGAYTGRLANGGERVQLAHAVGTPIFTVAYSDQFPWPNAADGSGFSLVPMQPNLNPAPEESQNWRSSSAIGGSPGADDPTVDIPAVVINEVLTHTDPPDLDSIELHNPGSNAADVSFWYVTDDRALPKKFQFPAGSVIPAGGFLVLTEADFNGPGAASAFTLNSHGEEVFLYSADAAGELTGYSHGFSFGAAANGVSFGRFVTSAGDWQYPAQVRTTLGSINAGPAIGPVVINELYYAPAPGHPEFIELKNVSSVPIKLFDPEHPENAWNINGAGFTFPNVELAPNGLALIVSSEPSLFRSQFNIPAQVPIFGPFPGSLQDGGERIQIRRPDKPDTDPNGTTVVPYIVVDEVRYSSRAPWPENAVGTGVSIEKLNAPAYGNDPSQWRASPGPASPGLENTGNRLPQIDAGNDQTLEIVQVPATAQLAGRATDDGLPNPPSALHVLWTQVQGPGTAEFATPNALSTQVQLPGIGTYVFRMTASDGELAASDEVSVVTKRAPSDGKLISEGSTWKYLDDGSNQGLAWRALNFNDTSWKSGQAQLGYGDGDEKTKIGFGPDDRNKFVTTYFRRAFDLSNPESVIDLAVRLLRDDGAIVYLNGTEVFRSNMPEGEIGYRSNANAAVGGGEESTFWEQAIDPTLLVAGKNVIAVELHQANNTSSDTSFDLALIAQALPSNGAPKVQAGADQAIELPNRASLNASATDDGLPIPPGLLSVSWTKTSGPGDVTFDPAGMAKTSATFSAPGVYELRVTASDGALTATDTLIISVQGDDLSSWRSAHFTSEELGNPSISGDDADPDGDRHTNLEEYLAGTIPTDADSVLRFVEILSGLPAQPHVTVRFWAQPGRSYGVQFADDLSDGEWQVLGVIPTENEARLVELSDSQVIGGSNRYYRIIYPAP